tara:strand:- start:27338 stop:28102 length:765 start_codon:yes stop_codon:yes gene_type:complete
MNYNRKPDEKNKKDFKLNNFTFIVPTFNAEKTIAQCILSVVCQSYPHWKLIIQDDMSTDKTVHIIKTLSRIFQIQDKIILTENKEKLWEVKNILEGLKHCTDDDIVCRLDGDDWMADLDALAIINTVYNEEECDALWTAHRWAFSPFNISKPMAEDVKDVYEHPWVSSHFKTFKKNLINNVADENFRNKDGEYFKRIGDQAIYLPVLHNAKKRFFLPIVAYHYSIDVRSETFQTEDAKFQKSEAEFLRERGYVG